MREVDFGSRDNRRQHGRIRPDQLDDPRLTPGQRDIGDLQRKAGNAAVTTLLAVQRDGGHALAAPPSTDIDDQARAIITAAQGTSPAVEERAKNAVRAILDTYYADKRSLVSGIQYVASEPGLLTTSQGRGERSTGLISVGQYFVTNTTEQHFARRVLQVGHELEHIQQYREGKGGEGHRHEREFLAFFHEATNPALPHTGRIAHATRVDLMDQAIRHYNAMPEDQKRQYADKHQQLLDKRGEEQRKSGHSHTDPPTEAAP